MFQVKRLSMGLRWCLEIIFVIGTVITIGLPYFFRKIISYDMGRMQNEQYSYDNILILILIISGIGILLIIRVLIGIMKTIYLATPFVNKNAKRLANIAYLCILISILFLILGIVRPTPLTFVVCFIFIVAGLACIVFSKLFEQAVEYKNENDLTI